MNGILLYRSVRLRILSFNEPTLIISPIRPVNIKYYDIIMFLFNNSSNYIIIQLHYVQ